MSRLEHVEEKVHEPTDQFVDPSNASLIVEELTTLGTCKDVLDKIKSVYPEWIVTYINNYSDDYPTLTRNWNFICSKAQTTPTKIIIVKHIKFDSFHVCVCAFAELLTIMGNCVRQEEDLGMCTVCGAAIPSQPMWQIMKEKGLDVPEVWSLKCKKC